MNNQDVALVHYLARLISYFIDTVSFHLHVTSLMERG